MNGINNSYDRHLDPQEYEEATDCDECGEEMTKLPMLPFRGFQHSEWTCENLFCPGHFDVTTTQGNWGYKVANELVATKLSLSSTQATLKYVRAALAARDYRIGQLELRIEELEEWLARSQLSGVLRETEYQIRRMNDALENLPESQEATDVRLEWVEARKILRSSN